MEDPSAGLRDLADSRQALAWHRNSAKCNLAEGDAARFNALLTEYKKAPEVTRRRIYMETLQDVLPDIKSKIVVDEATQGILPLLNLDAQREGQ